MTLLERVGIELPIVQAGMGGGVARRELAVAVSETGGLGALGFMPAGALARELQAAREATSRPLAVNLLLPFARESHWDVARRADVVVTFWGRPRRRTDGTWLHQAGSVAEARAAHAAGADGVIVQGVEAGGHVRGTVPARELLAAVRAALPLGHPLWLAGGIAAPADVRAAFEAGAEAAVLGTRFLMSPESRAHAGYKARVAASSRTILTDLFAAGWVGTHRVVPNAATERWLSGDGRAPSWLRALNRLSEPLVQRSPYALSARLAARQRAWLPVLSPLPPTDDGPPDLVEMGPLYAGQTATRIAGVRPAGELVRELAGRA